MIQENKALSSSPINILAQYSQHQKSMKPHHELKDLVSSPKLAKILKKVKTPLKEIEYITFEEFLERQNESNDYYDENDDYERYEQQLQRRKKQVEILLEMEENHFQKNHHNSQTVNNAQNGKYHNLSRQAKYIQGKRSHRSHKNERSQVKVSSSSQYEHHPDKLRNRKVLHRKTSVTSSHVSRQRSTNSRFQSHKRVRELQIFQTYTQGKPYIEEYYNKVYNKIDKKDLQRVKTMSTSANQNKSRRSSRIGKISKQKVSKQTAENQYQNQTPKKSRQNQQQKKQSKEINKFQQNEYDMIPSRSSRAVLNQKKSKHHDIQICKQLITEVKKYQQINHNYVKKLNQLDKNDKKSREKLMAASSRDKLQKKLNIDKLKNRISSKTSRKEN